MFLIYVSQEYPPSNSRSNASTSVHSSNKIRAGSVNKTNEKSTKTESPPTPSPQQQPMQKSPQNSSDSSSPNRNSTVT